MTNIGCWQQTLKAHGYIDNSAPPAQSEADLIRQIESAGRLKIADFDLESIDSEQSYVRLLDRISRLVGDELALRRIKSLLDESAGSATVQFEWRDRPYQWTFEQVADWVSDEFINKVFEFVAEHSDGRLIALPCSDPYLYVAFVPVETAEALSGC
jgi:hypothetical protein